MNNKKHDHPSSNDIRQAILNPESSTLRPDQQRILKRFVTASFIISQNPAITKAVEIHRSKYPELSHSEAETDIRLASQVIYLTNISYSGNPSEMIKKIILRNK